MDERGEEKRGGPCEYQEERSEFCICVRPSDNVFRGSFRRMKGDARVKK